MTVPTYLVQKSQELIILRKKMAVKSIIHYGSKDTVSVM